MPKGVSYVLIGEDRWRVRWRERTPEGGWRSRETTFVGGERGLDGVQGYVLQVATALRDEGRWNPKNDRLLPRPPANLLELLGACIEARTAAGRYTGQSPKTFRSYRMRLARGLYAALDLPRDQVLPVTILRRESFELYMRIDAAEGVSAMMRYAPLRFLLDAWTWADHANREADQARQFAPWPHLPPAPPASTWKDYTPRSPKYGRTVAPTVAHIDACLRHLAQMRVYRQTRILAVLLRYTGLRAAQAIAIQREDLDLEARTLIVRQGKSAAERADQRVLPLGRALASEPEVWDWLRGVASGPIFPNLIGAGHAKSPSRTLRGAWEAATAAGEVPEQVWKPHNRAHSRPEHAFRAAFQAMLVDARVDDDVVDFLVGHEGGVRETHYGRDLVAGARAAVDAIPPVDWGAPPENVVALHTTVRR